jgi:SAM-dependent methyltransferase
MLTGKLSEPIAKTADAFGWQWHAFPEQLPAFHEEFLEWLAPVSPGEFQGRRVLDAGCGKGRHLLVAAQFSPQHIVGLDLSSAVDVARRATTEVSVVDVVQGNLLTPPFGEGRFDLVYSIGVVHHVPRPSEAIRALASCLRPGGTLHVWVYSHEGNALVRWAIDPVRRQLSRRAPRGVVRAGTLPLTIILLGAAHVAQHLDRFLPRLPYRQYLRHIAGFSIPQVWTIIFDQLMAPTTHYVKRHELEQWFREAGLVNIRIRQSRGMSWTGTGQRPATESLP